LTRSIGHVRHRVQPGKGFLGSIIDPIDRLSETIFSILIFLLYVVAFRFIINSGAPEQSVSDESMNELLFGVISAVVAWGLIDGIMYALLSLFERGERHRLLLDIQAAGTEQEALNVIADDMDYLLEPITGEEERMALYRSVLIHLQNSQLRKIGLKREDISGILGHVLVAIFAVIPSLLPLVVLQHYFELAILVSILISFAVLFVSGYSWARYTGANPWKTGLLIMSVAVGLVLIAVLLGG
jgi:hypothetical protein